MHRIFGLAGEERVKKKMDPDLTQDTEGSLGGAGTTADVPTDGNTASEVHMPETTGHDETHPQPHSDYTEAFSGVVDPAEIVVEQGPTESNRSSVVDDDRTVRFTTTRGTAVVQEQLLPPQQVSDDDLRSDGRLWVKASARSSDTTSPPHSAAGREEVIIDDRESGPEEFPTADPGSVGAVNSPTGSTAPQRAASQVRLSSPTSSSSNSEADSSGGTDGEERSSTEGKHHKQPEMDIKEATPGGGGGGGGWADHTNDLPTQLNRVWGASPPDRAEGLAVMRDMVGYRDELDGILSRLVAVKVQYCHLNQS